MLDHLNPPPARLVAQMRAIAATHKLPEAVADMLASRPGMTAQTAERLAPGLAAIQAKLAADRRGTPSTAGHETPREVIDAAHRAFFDATAAAAAMSADEVKQAALGALWDAQAAHDERNFPMAIGAPRYDPVVLRHSDGRISIGQSWDHGQGLAAKMAEGLAARFSPHVKPEKGREFAGATMGALAMAWQRAHGESPWSERDAIRAVMAGSHSSSDFISTVIGASVDLSLSRGYAQAEPEIARASRAIDRDDYRLWTMVRTGAAETLAPVNEGGEFTHTTLDDEGEEGPRPQINGKIFRVTEEAVANDRIGALASVSNAMIRGAVERVRQGLCEVIVGADGFGKIMRDAEPLFDAAHGNLEDGAAIGVTSLGLAIAKMRRQTGVGGEALDIRPRFLIVPPELETAGRQMLATITATTVAEANPWGGELELLVEPGLADPARWYLCADPMMADGLAHAWVGRQGPTVETRLGWETATVEFKARMDVGFGMLDWRAWTMNPGAGG